MKNTNLSVDTNWSTGEAELFRTLALRYVDIAAKEGIKVVPFQSPEMPLFLKANQEDRSNAINHLQTIVDIFEETLASGDRALNSRKLIWRALSKLSLIPRPDVFENFSDEDVVVIYADNQISIFWNLQFFRYSSFTVEQMFFCAWHEYTRRSAEIHQSLYDLVVNILSGKLTKSFVPNVPGHEVQELNTLECLKTWMEIPFCSILNRDGKMAGYLVVQNMKVIE